MTKEDLAEQIIAAFDGEDWEMLDAGSPDLPVKGFFRKTLLKLMDPLSDYSGEVCDEKVEEFHEGLKAFLKEIRPDQPESHKYIISACMILTFLDELPMHPQRMVGYYTRLQDEEREYFCPEKGSSAACRFCVARSCEPLFKEWGEKTAVTAGRFGGEAAFVQKCIFESGFLHSGVIKTGELHFREEVRKYCRENACHHYNSTWACPPAVGTVDECRERTCGFDYLQLFSKAYYLPNAFDWNSMKPAVADFKKAVDELDAKLRPAENNMMILANDSCNRCKTCTYPDAPCRIPKKLHHSIEGYGFFIAELAKQAGIPYNNGKDMITLFGAVLHNA